jgi:hypothetical protein
MNKIKSEMDLFQSVGVLYVSETKALEPLRSVLKLEYERNHQGTEP